MKKKVYQYYKDELDYLREHGKKFAEAHEDIADQLDFAATKNEDPFVRRLVEAFAFLTARIRLKLDDDFPLISEAMLEQMLPFATRPLPSFSIARFELPPENADSTERLTLNKDVVFELKETGHVKFSTSFNTDFWPVKVKGAEYRYGALDLPEEVLPYKEKIKSCLDIDLCGLSEQTNFDEFEDLDELVFYVQNELYGFSIHEFIVNTGRNFGALTLTGPDGKPQILSANDIEMVGLDEDQAMLPYNRRGFFGFQLLAEFLAFPQKFQFFKIKLKNGLKGFGGSQAKLTFYFQSERPELESKITADTFMLGCTPVQNLFASPGVSEFDLDNFQTKYEVVPDISNPNLLEIYSIQDVVATGEKGVQETFQPFYQKANSYGTPERRYWHAERSSLPSDRIRGSQVDISFVDLDFDRSDIGSYKSVRIKTLCMNRELFDLKKARTDYGIKDSQSLESFEGTEEFNHGTFVEGFTQAIPATLDTKLYLRLISHLNAKLSDFSSEFGLETLQLIFAEMDFLKTGQTKELASLVNDISVHTCVEKLSNISSINKVCRAPDSQDGDTTATTYLSRNSISVCRGSKIVIEVDQNRIEDKAWYQMMCVLDRFFVHYASLNSFTKLEIRSNLDKNVLAKFQAQCGEKRVV